MDRRTSRRPKRFIARIIRGRHAVNPRLRRVPLAALGMMLTGAIAIGSLAGGLLPALASIPSPTSSSMVLVPLTAGGYSQTGNQVIVDPSTHIVYSLETVGGTDYLRASDYRPNVNVAAGTAAGTTVTARKTLTGTTAPYFGGSFTATYTNGARALTIDLGGRLSLVDGAGVIWLYNRAASATQGSLNAFAGRSGNVVQDQSTGGSTPTSFSVSGSAPLSTAIAYSAFNAEGEPVIASGGTRVSIILPSMAMDLGFDIPSGTVTALTPTPDGVYAGSSTPGGPITYGNDRGGPSTFATPAGTLVSGLALDAPNNRLYVTDKGNGGRILSYDVSAGYNATPTLVHTEQLSAPPSAVAVDSSTQQIWVGYTNSATVSSFDVYHPNTWTRADLTGTGPTQSITVDESLSAAYIVDTSAAVSLSYEGQQWTTSNGVRTADFVFKGATLPSVNAGTAYGTNQIVHGLSYINPTATGLPSGLSLSADGSRLTGTPSVAGLFTPVLSGTAAGLQNQILNDPTTSVFFNPLNGRTGFSPTIGTATLPAFSVYPAQPVITTGATQTISMANPSVSISVVAPYMTSAYYPNNWTLPVWSWAAAGGSSLPPGLTLNTTTGVVSGTATTPGSYNVDVTAANDIGVQDPRSNTALRTNTKRITFTVNAVQPVLQTANPPSAVRNAAYSTTIATTAGTSPITLTSNSTMPPGLNFSNGVISGTPTTTGSTTISVSASNTSLQGGSTTSRNYTITVGPVPVSWSGVAAPTAATQHQPYIWSPTGITGDGISAYALTSNNLPAGLAFNTTTGVISGTPTAAFSGTITLRATGTAGAVSQTYPFAVTVAAPVFNPSTVTAPQAQSGSAYSYQPVVNGGSNATSWTISGTLPAGLSFNTSTGVISGTPTNSATSQTVTVTAINSGGSSSPALTLSIPVLTLPVYPATTTPPNGYAGSSYSSSVAPGGVGPFTYTTSPALPAGVSIDSAGNLVGTAPAAGTYTFTLTATNSNGGSASTSLTWVVQAGVTLPAATLPTATDQTAYTSGATIAAAGGSGGYQYALAMGSSLPLGLSLSAAGTITGSTSGITGTSTFSVVATDSGGRAATRAYTLTVMQANPVLPVLSLPNGTVGVAYAQVIQATGTEPIIYSISAGALPPGITQSGKNLGGTPTTVGTYTFTVRAENDHTPYGSGFGTHQYAITIDPAPVSWSAVTAPGAVTVGQPYSWTPTGITGTGPISYALTSGPLPAGLTLNTATGQISGTTATAGSFPITIAASNAAAGSPVSRSYTLVSSVLPPVLPSSLTATASTTGSAYAYQVATTGGSPATSYSYTGTLPTGLSFNTSTGAITGTPANSAVTSAIQVTASNTGGPSSPMALTVPVTNLPVYTSASTTLATGTAGAAYTASLVPSGVGPFTYSVVSGSLPAGLSINASGQIVGTAPAAGTYTFSVRATNANGSAAVAVTLPVQAAPTALPNVTAPTATVGTGYAYTPQVTGTALTFTATGLPAGWTINPNSGQITGTPGTVGTTSIVVTATNQVGTVTQTVNIPAIAAPGFSPASTTLGAALVGSAYTQTLPAPTGTGPFTYTVTSGSLPAGLVLNSATGVVTGTPTVATSGPATFTVTATNPAGTAPIQVSLTVNSAPSFSPATRSVSGAVGTTITPVSLTATGTGPFTYTVTGGPLPAGLILNPSTGAISGNPTAVGTANFTVTATNAYGTAQLPVTFTAGTAPSIPATQPPLAVIVGTPVTATVVPSAGTGPFTFSVTGGSLPPGLSLNAPSGVLSGTPTTPGPFAPTVTVTSPFGTATTTLTVSVAAPTSTGGTGTGTGGTGTSTGGTGTGTGVPTPGATPRTAPPQVGTAVSVTTGGATAPVAATIGQPYTALLAPSTAPSGTVFSTTGALPPGLSVGAGTGTITGTPTRAGTYTFTLTGIAPSGAVLSTSVTLVVNPAGAPSFAILAPSTTSVGATWNVPAIGTGLTYAVKSGSLPSGVTLNGTTGSLVGSPSAPGIYRFVLTGSSGSATASQSYAVMVTAPVGSVPAATGAIALAVAAGQSAGGATATGTAKHLLPGSTWTIMLHSKPVLLGTGTVTGSGTLAKSLTLPKTVPAGAHRLILTAVSSTGQSLIRIATFTVTKNGTATPVRTADGSGRPATPQVTTPATKGTGGSLASTGVELTPYLGALVLLGAVGTLLILAARRRRVGR